MRISLRKKVLGLTLICVFSIAAVISVISIRNITSRGEERIAAYRATLLSERKQQIKGYVEMAVRVVERLPAEDAKKVIRSLRYGQSGYLWINDFKNVMILHPDPRLEGKDQSDLRDPNGVYILREITRVCREKGEGFLNYMWKVPGQEEMKPKISFAKAIPGKDWIIGTGIYVDDVEKAVLKERGTIRQEVSNSIVQYIAISLTVLVLMQIMAFFLVNRFIAGPIETITGRLKNFDNDLTASVPVTTADEVGELARWFNEHIGRLHHIIVKLSGITDKIHSHSGAIASTMDQQSGFATQLSSSVVEISSTMEEFSSTASQIAQHSQGVVERADKTLADSKNGAAEVENLTFKINDISQNIQANLSEIVELGRKSKEINKVMEIINNIANQTKLIAFNAALEAASAGEAGKRFGVVAVEIRRLADSVVESTAEIEGKITEILDSVNRLVMSSEKSSQLIQEGQEYASHTVVMLIESVDGVEETANAARQISLSTQQQQIASSQVVLALKDIEQGVRFSTDSIYQTNGVTSELAELSEQLRTLVSTFKIGAVTGNNETPVDRENC
ncbi:methyl-accepting chemotaxis protein 4 [Geobacter sp. OR-1]|uniref:methyl-accepting chemotaxis protein n=1 Tax=Geobacter sp. OR-1 TaxID=1266765 RepID=UPI0005444BE8|nr:methyl-accepting chemotaxis protein [Geobacter sp. OR-1]GAM09099.1 methyl-accepting chemotaxis protein 4 [Geobacter sp. OR-1]